ncbi:hypothetical protein L0152_13225 [bacterium]|nr:hypothetical protein [bacterium]
MGDSPAIWVSENYLHQIISDHPCFEHYVNIPDRICSSLDLFDRSYNRTKVHEVLKSFYLFIGIVDHAMDTISISVARNVLDQLKQPNSFSETVLEILHQLATELLKKQIDSSVYDAVLDRFSQLCEAVYYERCSKTIFDYIQHRKKIGYLTAEISYLLIKPFLNNCDPEILKFFCEVGEVGCLVDSLIDLRSDYKRGLIIFRPNLNSYLKVTIQAASIGIPLLWRYPKLIHIFYQAVVDNCRDFKR